MASVRSRARLIPSIERLRQSAQAQALEATYGRPTVVDALRAETAALRVELSKSPAANIDNASAREDGAARAELSGPVPASPAAGSGAPNSAANAVDALGPFAIGEADRVAALLLDRAARRLGQTMRSRLRSVINATGVIIHTNLGRAPLCEAAIERVSAIGRGYASLEYDLDQGARGRRDVHADPLLRQLTGAEAAIVVNNNAAAVLLMLTALAQGREVIISRGELVEIGGGFRVPDVMRQSGALLREVGTTNRTRVADYAAAISDRTALILRVHPSNFVIEGFTERPALADLTALGRQFNVPVVEDLGSGYLESSNGNVTAASAPASASAAASTRPSPLHDEPSVQASLRAGIDAVTFSGDKLLGGPQAGIIAGRRAQIDIMRRHPLMRALRADKLTYAALEGTLLEYTLGRAQMTVPVQQMLALDTATLSARANALASRLPTRAGLRTAIIDGQSAIGGGSAPAARLPTPLLAVEVDGLSADALLTQLRHADPPIIARIEHDRVVFDLRTVSPAQDDQIAAALAKIVGEP